MQLQTWLGLKLSNANALVIFEWWRNKVYICLWACRRSSAEPSHVQHAVYHYIIGQDPNSPQSSVENTLIKIWLYSCVCAYATICYILLHRNIYENLAKHTNLMFMIAYFWRCHFFPATEFAVTSVCLLRYQASFLNGMFGLECPQV